MIDKDISSGLASLRPLVDTFVLTRPEGERAAEPEQLAACLPQSSQAQVILERDVQTALRRAEELATPEDMIVVAGSLYLIGAVRRLLIGELVES
jgi:dihydrofolate synthase/folylpolyglutamate synthase